ncbi:MAG: FG-GAP repeat protein, partial [Planctomycetes bacterium]|nr:FG-GAP repeat protein [Planctomycetota bacterium]
MCFKTAPKKSKRGLIGKILSGSLLILSCSQYRVLANELLEAANLGGRGVAFESPFPGEIQTVREVAGIGDFDGDGFDDLAVSFKVAEEGDSDRWAVGIIFGRPGLNGRHELPGGIPRLATFEFRDKYDYPYAYEISHVGDLNADGLDDLMLGYPETTYSLSPIHGRGMTFLIFGSPKLEGKLFLEDIGVTVPGVIFYSSNPEHDGIGRRIATIGDFNNDGKTDLVITAPFSGIEDRNNAGAAFVLFEIKELPNFVDLDQVGKSVPGFVILGDPLYRPIIQKTFGEMLGFGLSPAGDFNGDQVPDFAILAPIISNVAGVPEPARAYVIYGDGSRQAPLAVHRVIPGWGPMRGNTRVVVEGSGFRSDVQVFFGGILASGIQVVSESQIEALT